MAWPGGGTGAARDGGAGSVPETALPGSVVSFGVRGAGVAGVHVPGAGECRGRARTVVEGGVTWGPEPVPHGVVLPAGAVGRWCSGMSGLPLIPDGRLLLFRLWCRVSSHRPRVPGPRPGTGPRLRRCVVRGTHAKQSRS